ncbi:MAG: hypothetical protein KC964_30450, partial [Candidatus Omnitrophica bacterium]|nr:hypothetical protein [Candidatus Omnitrophota bacterium]
MSPQALEVVHRNSYEGFVIPDHTPLPECDAPRHAGLAHAVGYLRGILDCMTRDRPGPPAAGLLRRILKEFSNRRSRFPRGARPGFDNLIELVKPQEVELLHPGFDFDIHEVNLRARLMDAGNFQGAGDDLKDI